MDTAKMITHLTGLLKSSVSHGAMMLGLRSPMSMRERARSALGSAKPVEQAIPVVASEPPANGIVDVLAYQAVADAILPAADAITNVSAAATESSEAVANISEALHALYSVGQVVEWTSSNTRKRGTITHVLSGGQLPSDVNVRIKDATTPRDHQSYIVEAEVSGRKNRYWPRVSLLSLAD